MQIRGTNLVEVNEAALAFELVFTDDPVFDQRAVFDAKVLASFCCHEQYSMGVRRTRVLVAFPVRNRVAFLLGFIACHR